MNCTGGAWSGGRGHWSRGSVLNVQANSAVSQSVRPEFATLVLQAAGLPVLWTTIMWWLPLCALYSNCQAVIATTAGNHIAMVPGYRYTISVIYHSTLFQVIDLPLTTIRVAFKN